MKNIVDELFQNRVVLTFPADPEKPISDKAESELAPGTAEEVLSTAKSVKSVTSKRSVKPPKPQPTARAKLGLKASKFLKKGKPVDDQCVVEILTEAIRRIPEGTGWVIDGFPTTYSQAKLLEKALSGFDGPDKSKSSIKLTEGKKGKKSTLAPDPRPPPPPAEPTSGINVVVVFDIPDELAMKRSAGRTCKLNDYLLLTYPS